MMSRHSSIQSLPHSNQHCWLPEVTQNFWAKVLPACHGAFSLGFQLHFSEGKSQSLGLTCTLLQVFAFVSRSAAEPSHSVEKPSKGPPACLCICCRRLTLSERGLHLQRKTKLEIRTVSAMISCRTPCCSPRSVSVWPCQPLVGRQQLKHVPAPSVQNARRVAAAGFLDKLFGSKVFLVPGPATFGFDD